MTNFYSGWATPPNGGAKYRIRFAVDVISRNVAANQTTLRYAMYLEKDRSYNGFWNWSDTNWSSSVDGAAGLSGSGANPSAPWTGWATHLVGEGTQVVTHAANGTKTVSVVANYTGANSGWSIGAVSISTSMELPTIPRATEPVASPSPVIFGRDVEITLARADASYTHDLTWVSGTLSGSIGTGVGASATWTVPDVMGEFPGVALAPITITAVTKSGGVAIGSKQFTLLVRDPPEPPVVTPLTPATQFDIRARVVEFDDGEWLAKSTLPANTIKLSTTSSGTATCSIGMSSINRSIESGTIVDTEVYTGSQWVSTGNRFVMSRLEGDDVDPTGAKTYTGTEFIDFMLKLAYTQKEYKWEGATKTNPGQILLTLLNDAQSRGWGPRIEFDFTGAKASLGDPWANSEVEITISKGTPLSQVLSGLVEDGVLEYTTSYHDNKAFIVLMNPGTGSDFTARDSEPVVNLNLLPLTSAPRRSTIESKINRVTVVGDDDATATREKASTDPDVFGMLEGWVTASGAKTASSVGAIGDRALADSSSTVNERTFAFSASSAKSQHFPLSVYRPGDWVLVPDAKELGVGNTIKDRISQITVDKGPDGTEITVVTGDRILSGTASLAKRQNAQTGGSISGGTQRPLASLDSRIPRGPSILATGSAGYWDSDGAAKSAVTIEWSEVTLAMSEADISVGLYELWSRPTGIGAQWRFISSTSDLEVTVGGWDVLATHDFRVRAQSVDGIYGEFSEDQSLTTLAPAVDLDGPIIADLYTDGVGSIYISWAGILGSEPAPARLAYVVAEVSTDEGATYVTTGTPITGAGTIVLNIGVWGDYLVRIRGYDRLGNAGDASGAEAITLDDPHVDPPAPEAPTGLTSTAGAAWDASGFFPSAWFDLTWDVPTLDVDGEAINIVGYDIWGGEVGGDVRFITTSSTNSVRAPAINGQEWVFVVKASSEFGGVSAFSDAVTDIADATITVADAPDAPSLSQYAGILRIQWSGNGMVPSIKYAYATISTNIAGPFTRAGMPLNGAGEVVVPGLATATEYFAKIVMVDELGQTSTSAASAGVTLDPITGVTLQTSAVANTGIKITSGSLTSYDVSGNPTFILDATTGEVWIAPYDAVFALGAPGAEAETGDPTTGISISSESSSFNTFIHPSGVQIRNDQTPLSWWEADVDDAELVNFFSPRAVVGQRMRMGDYEFLRESKSTGSRLVVRYKGA